MAEYKKREWLIVGNTERCGKRCVNNLGGIHRAQLRRRPGSKPHPCRRCDRGTKSESWLWRKDCGADRVQKSFKMPEVRAKRNHGLVMDELLAMARRQRERERAAVYWLARRANFVW